MAQLIQFLMTYGYAVVFGVAFAEQMGLPVPAATLLISMGALSRSGEVDFVAVVASGAAAALSADLIWFQLGRLHGRYVLRLLCRISLEPDYCVRRTEDKFERWGLWALLPAKFIPGFNAATVPLAGLIKTPLLRFVIFDAPAVVLWSCAYTTLGYLFSAQIQQIIGFLPRFGALILTLAVLYVAYKIVQKRRYLKTLSVTRITPEELKARMDANKEILIFDLRNRLDRNTDPVRIPGAFHVLPDHIDFQPKDIRREQEIVLYCTCPNEATSAKVAMQLQRNGHVFARPLQGGLDAWRELNLPVEVLD